MKIIIFLAALMLSQNVESREEYFIVDCGRDSIMFPHKMFPLGLPLSDKEICNCTKQGFNGHRCNMDLHNQMLFLELERKNNLIIERLLRGRKYDRRTI